MTTVKQQASSRTIQFNAIVPALFGIAKAIGYEVPAEVMTGILALGNYFLRFRTKEPLEDK